ncbi:MAG: hypothetical protein IIW52_02530 [Alistipes sp.]|nr:hypothetical protein [Alistipes sp.]
MKKLISIVAAFFLGLFISISIIACADNDSNAPTGMVTYSEFKALKEELLTLKEELQAIKDARMLKIVDTDEDGSSILTFEYNELGRITHISGYQPFDGISWSHNITYSENTISLLEDGITITVNESTMKSAYCVNEIVKLYSMFW